MVAKAVDVGGDRLVASAASAVGRLVERLRARFRDEADDAGAAALVHVEEVPDSPSRLKALAESVDRLAQDAEFRAELEGLVAAAEDAGVRVDTITQVAWGDQNVQIGGVSGSRIDVRSGDAPRHP